MKTTRSRKVFKEELGQANHFLITSLIGISAIYDGHITHVPQEFSTSWNPKDPRRSAERTRAFMLNAFLMRASDGLQTYLSLLHGPINFYDHGIYEGQTDGLRSRCRVLGKHYGVDPLLVAMVDLLVGLRNISAHSEASLSLKNDSLGILRKESSRIKDEYCGLELDDLLTSNDKPTRPLTFKETASLIRALHKFVEEFDASIIKKANIFELCKSLVVDKLNFNPQFRQKYTTYTLNRRENLILNFLEEAILIDKKDDIEIVRPLFSLVLDGKQGGSINSWG